MTLNARFLFVQLVTEFQLARPRCMCWNGHHRCHRFRRVILGCLVTGSALCLCRCLVVTNLTAAWRLECEKTVSIACLMTDEARKFLVPRVWKAVGRSGRRGRRSNAIHESIERCGRDHHTFGNCDRRTDFFRRLSFTPPKSFQSIEWKRRFELSARAHAQMTTFAVARIDLCAVRTMAGETL